MTKRIIKIDKRDQESLYKRYLLWLYKTTKDELDKIERKFTQLDIDRQIQKILKKKSDVLKSPLRGGITPFLEEGKEYIFEKESDAQKLKLTEEGLLNPKYLFLHLKLEAITQITKIHFGQKGLEEFKRLYEEAALRRILEDTSERR